MATRWTLRRFISAKNVFTRSDAGFPSLQAIRQANGCELMRSMKIRAEHAQVIRSATHFRFYRRPCRLCNLGIGADLLESTQQGSSFGNSRAPVCLDHHVPRRVTQLATAVAGSDRKSSHAPQRTVLFRKRSDG